MNNVHNRTRIAALALLVAVSIVRSVAGSSALTAPRSSGVEVYLPFVARQAGPAPTATPTPTPLPPTATPTPIPVDVVSAPAGNGVAAFRIGRTEVTNAQYAQCVAAGACTLPSYTTEPWSPYNNSAYANHPVVYVSRAQAQAYAAWAYAAWAGGSLPTNAQWTRACQGDDGRPYPWGNQPPDATRANYYPGTGPVGDTTAVGSYPAGASPYGALDMAGNVWEWVDDGNFALRGGAFDVNAVNVVCGARDEDEGDVVFGVVGFRVVSPGP
jgi:hypothetical protein